jgi:hypothetical protein
MSGTCLPSIIQQQLCSNDILLPETIENHPVSDIIKAAIKKDGEKRIEDASELYEKLSHIDLSTLSQSTTTHRQALSTYTDNRNAPQTLIFNDTKTLLDTEQPQAITALCITIALHCNSNAHELIDKKSRETLLRRLYEEKKNQCISVIQKYGATLAGRLVDTLLFYFGYPKPLSTDSLICAKAALEIAQTLNQPVYMDDKRIKIFCTVHIGIHASSFWKGNHAFPDGEIPRTAMTLARSAGANQILCSRPTHDILCSQAYFETSYIEKYYQYNTQSPSYAIIREHGETTVDSLRFKTNLLPLIGHENELNQLAHITALKSDEKQEARCAHIHGEGGIGKSRILAELCLQKSSLAIWSMQCIPQNKNSELSTILSLVKRMYGLNLVSEEKVVIKIKRLLNESSHLDPLRSTAILCSWLNLKPHEASSTSHTAVRSARKELFDILTFLLCKNNSGQLGKKALFILDDMHWLDTTSLQFISEFISSNAFKESGHTLLTSSRQSIPSILYRQIKTVLKIDRLDNDNAMALIAASLNSQQVSRQLTDLIAQRTNGIPFFIIEFVRMLKENNWLQRLNGKVSIIESNSIPLIPYTLRDLLEKRLDNLAGDMKVVQFASAFGEEFGYDALKSSIGSNSVELNTTLDELLKHDLIRVKRSAGKKNFMFKHELLREAAYNSMPQELKQEAQQLIFYSQQKHLLSSNNDIKPVVLTRRTDGNFTQ